MSYIIKEKEDIERLKQFLELMRYKAFSDKLIEETIAILTESMKNFVIQSQKVFY